MNTTQYKTYTRYQIKSKEDVEIDLACTFSDLESIILDCHAITNARFTISDAITEWTKKKTNNNIEDKPIEILFELTALVNGSPMVKSYDLTNKIPSKYQEKINLERLLDYNGTSFSQERDLGKTIVFDGTSNLKIKIKTKNLLSVQINKLDLLIRPSDQIVIQ